MSGQRVMWLLWRTPIIKRRLFELWKAGYDMGVAMADLRHEHKDAAP